jgi:hypothetical protein
LRFIGLEAITTHFGIGFRNAASLVHNAQNHFDGGNIVIKPLESDIMAQIINTTVDKNPLSPEICIPIKNHSHFAINLEGRNPVVEGGKEIFFVGFQIRNTLPGMQFQALAPIAAMFKKDHISRRGLTVLRA